MRRQVSQGGQPGYEQPRRVRLGYGEKVRGAGRGNGQYFEIVRIVVPVEVGKNPGQAVAGCDVGGRRSLTREKIARAEYPVAQCIHHALSLEEKNAAKFAAER